ncbi:hypothetical protein Dsin_002533 [Dipteronia sinensis]|uniref:Reverse transcriptase domain-containing protein n=1 Tax=Dipteronia sinensis TaxID=43782 RepID=A0AAE0B7A1_9ROSI|nr:hypothetical protein Dsin_002533 [Dipteronia sinensis]
MKEKDFSILPHQKEEMIYTNTIRRSEELFWRTALSLRDVDLHLRFIILFASTDAHPNQVHTTVSVVSWLTPYKRKRNGLCSTWLAGLDHHQTWFHKGSLPRPPPSLPLILVGPGTGCAPFRGFVEERAIQSLSGSTAPIVCWLEEKALMKEISKGWSRLKCSGSTSRKLNVKIKAAKLTMKRWSQSYKKNSFLVDKWEKMLGEIDKRAVVEDWSCWRSLRKEEQTWRQKSRVRWLKEGDKNTKLFHLLANDRKRRNFIGDITVEGEVLSNPHQIRGGGFEHFKNHYKNVVWNRPIIKDLGLKQLSEEEKVKLEENFSIEEAWEALCSCDGNKAPGPDGLNLNFIKENWVVIREDFLKFLNEFFKDGSIVKELNNTFIALIPKVSKPTTLKEFRPISLVGSMYKILAKILANRIKKVMNSVIGENQMAFIQNRQLVDSYVIAEEIIHNWRKEMEGGLIVKIDFEKAYDSVDFQFLDSMMEGMGFGYKWRQWIRCCISTPAMSVLVNGSPTPQFTIERGLRQGDPLSPFLFNIVTEGLSALMNKAMDLGLMQGAYVGLKINFHKTCIVRVSKYVRNDPSWATALKCRSATLPLTYLGLPLGARPGLKTFWNPVVRKVEDRLALWKRRFLSK